MADMKAIEVTSRKQAVIEELLTGGSASLATRNQRERWNDGQVIWKSAETKDDFTPLKPGSSVSRKCTISHAKIHAEPFDVRQCLSEHERDEPMDSHPEVRATESVETPSFLQRSEQ